jgi:hypothetical protein
MSRLFLARIAAVLTAALLASTAPAAPEPACPIEPDLKTALTWWEPQKNVWTPIGWKDHLFRFQMTYNGHLLCTPAGILEKPHILKYRGQDFQLNFYPSAEGSLPPMPREETKLKSLDGGVGMQGWREDHVAPVLWTDYPQQAGIVMRQETFGHVKGGKEVAVGNEPLYAWVRLSVKHVDLLRAPKDYSFAVQLSRVYYGETGNADDSLYLLVRPAAAKLGTALTAKTLKDEKGGSDGTVIEQADGKVRVRVQPGGDATISFAETAAGSGIYNLQIKLPAHEGAHVDLLVPMLATPIDELAVEARLGFDSALAESDAFWSPKPATAARIHTPEKYINDAIARNIQLAQIVAERNPENGEYSFLSGSYGYDALWATPTSMVSHMFLDLLGYHELVEKHAQLFKANQGTVHPPGPAFKEYAGYFSTPKTLTTIDWLTDHGAVLELLSRHALLTGDPKFIDQWIDPIVKGCDFIKQSCAATDHDGAKGMMPPAVATDTGVPTQAVWNEAWNYKGLTTAVQLLKRLNHPRAKEFEQVAADFRTHFDEAFRAQVAKQPKWTDPRGAEHPVLPANLIPPPQHHLYDDAFLLDTGPLVLPWAGLMPADDPLMISFAEFFRAGPNNQLRRPQVSAIDRAVLRHEISSCEPCYSWNIVNSWRTGDRAKFIEGMYSLFAGAISTQTFINCEHRNAMYGNLFVAPLMTWSMRQAVIDDQLTDGELHLLRLAPLAWISSAEETVFENMPTQFGPVDLRWRLSDDGTGLNVSFTGHWRSKPGKIVIHAPPVPGLTQLTVNGRTVSATGESVINP